MRALAVIVFVLAGCDLQPPPKKQAPTAQRPGNVTPPAAGSGTAAKPPAPPPAPKPPAEATPPTPPTPPTTPTPGSAAAGSGGAPSCLEVATTIAELLVRTSKDASEKAANEQSRTQLVKSLSDGCTKAGWSEEARNCYMKATERAHIESCGKLVRAKAPADNPAGN